MTRGLEVVCLGSKSVDVRHRESIGFLIRKAGINIIVDCGPYTCQALCRCEVKASDIDLVIVTHDHLDHWIGLPWIINSALFEEYYGESEKPGSLIAVLPDLSVRQSVRDLISDVFLDRVSDGKLTVSGQGNLTLGEISVGVFPISHSVPNVGVIIRTNERKVVYISDTNLSDANLWKDQLCDADLVIFSVGGSEPDLEEVAKFGFTSVSRAAEMCKQAGAKRVWFFHLFDTSDQVQAKAEAEQVLGAEMATFPRFGERISI